MISISISMIRNTTQNDDFLASTDQLSSHAKLKYDANGILWLVLNYYPKGFISQFHLNVIAQSERASMSWVRRCRWLKLLKYSLSFWGVITGTLFQIPKETSYYMTRKNISNLHLIPVLMREKAWKCDHGNGLKIMNKSNTDIAGRTFTTKYSIPRTYR